MKKILKAFILAIVLFVPITIVNAASGSISVTGGGTVVQGNKVTLTVTLSSSTPIGGWEYDLSYDSSYLTFNSTSFSQGGTHVADADGNGKKSISYTYNFTAKRTGSTKVSISSYDVYAADMSSMSMSISNKTIKIITQEELEASYSTDATLKSITVSSEDGTNYELTPAFDKKTFEYSVEIPNEIEKVKVAAQVSDGNSSLNGTGDYELKEGTNPVELRVTAQKGNEQIYKLNINRKELDPIHISINGKDLLVVRRADMLPELSGMEAKTVTYNGEEIPALYSSITNITIVGLKNEEGDVFTYIFDNGKIEKAYIELKSTMAGIVPFDVEDNKDFKNYKVKEIEIEGLTVKALVLKDNSKFAIIYGLDATTNEYDYYSYDIKNGTLQKVNEELTSYFDKQLNIYRYIVIGSIALIVILLMIIIFRRPKKKLSKTDLDKIKEELTKEDDKVEEVEEIKIEEEPKKDKKKKNKLKEFLFDPEEEYEEEEETVVEEEPKKEEKISKTAEISNLLSDLEVKQTKKEKTKSIEDEIDDEDILEPQKEKKKVVEETEDELIKTHKIDLSELDAADGNDSGLTKRELKKLRKQEKILAKEEAKRQKRLLEDEF